VSFSEARRGCEDCACAASVCGFMRGKRCCRQLVRVAVCGYSLAGICALVILVLGVASEQRCLQYCSRDE